MELTSTLLCFLIATVTLTVYYFKNHFEYWKRKRVPHVEAQSPYGIFTSLRRNTGFYELFSIVYNKYKGTGPFAGIYMFSIPSVVLIDLDLIKNVLIKDFNKFENRGLFYNERDDPLTAHLFSLDGPQWRPLRGKLSPTFTSGKMKFMFPIIMSVGEELIKAISKEIKTNSDIEVSDLVARFTTDVIAACAFGIECNSLNDPDVLFRKMGKKVLDKSRSIHYMLFTEMFPKLARFLRIKRTPADIAKFFTRLVRETVEYREKNGVKRNDFMGLLIDLKNKTYLNSRSGEEMTALTITEIISQSFIFFVAGFETSSTTMGYALYELARHPSVQDKLRREVYDTLSRHNNELTYDGVKEMHYLDQVISETLRLYPPAVHLRRTASFDYPTNDPKYTIPKNAQIFIPVFGIQRDPEFYPNPEVFDPNRFTPEEIQKRHPMAWLAFGDGPRNCIGLRFGKMQVKVGLATLITHFKFSVTTDTLIPMKFNRKKIVLSSEKGITLRVEKI